MQNTLLLCIFLYRCILYFQSVALFWLLFLFQRFVESTFFCRMYKYIIFVIVIIIILWLSLFTSFSYSVCLFFFFYISLNVVPSPIRRKFNFKFYFFLLLCSEHLELGAPRKAQSVRVTLSNYCPLVKYQVNPHYVLFCLG